MAATRQPSRKFGVGLDKATKAPYIDLGEALRYREPGSQRESKEWEERALICHCFQADTNGSLLVCPLIIGEGVPALPRAATVGRP